MIPQASSLNYLVSVLVTTYKSYIPGIPLILCSPNLQVTTRLEILFPPRSSVPQVLFLPPTFKQESCGSCKFCEFLETTQTFLSLFRKDLFNLEENSHIVACHPESEWWPCATLHSSVDARAKSCAGWF